MNLCQPVKASRQRVSGSCVFQSSALILSIVGGTRSFNKAAQKQISGHVSEAAVVLLVLMLDLLSGIALPSTSQSSRTGHGQRRLAMAAVVSIPFLAVRAIYPLIATFNYKSPYFSMVLEAKSAVIIQATMGVFV